MPSILSTLWTLFPCREKLISLRSGWANIKRQAYWEAPTEKTNRSFRWTKTFSHKNMNLFKKNMLVIKRDGRKESVKFDKITARIEKLCYGLDGKYINPTELAMKVISGLYDGVSTQELDNLAAEIAATMTTKHPDFARLSARIAISNLHKTTSKSFSNTMKHLFSYVDPKTGQNAPLISRETWKVIREHAAKLDEAIIYDRDFNYDYFGFKTLERSYLMKIDGKPAERPQHMLMRVAIGIHGED